MGLKALTIEEKQVACIKCKKTDLAREFHFCGNGLSIWLVVSMLQSLVTHAIVCACH